MAHSRKNLTRRSSADFIPDAVYGANDGIVTTLVVISSIAGAAMSPSVILILGVANLVADGFSMGTSNMLALRSALHAATRPTLRAASRNGAVTFAAFVIAGFMPLAAYILPMPDRFRFAVACGTAAIALFGIGACRSIWSDRNWLPAGIEMLALGAIASSVAYAIGFVASNLVGAS